jgi:hypothetical protein
MKPGFSVFWVVVSIVPAACRSDFEVREPPSPEVGGPREPPAEPRPMDASVAEPPPEEGHAPAAEGGSPDVGAATPDGSVAGDCSGQPVAVAELTRGLVRTKTVLSLRGVVATSQKFRVSSGEKCWFGAFAADRDGDGSGGILLVAAVPRLEGAEPCPGGRDSLPDDLAPGDVIDAFGTFTEFSPSACAEGAPQLELIVHDRCPVRRSARGAPQPVRALDAALGAELARGSDRSLLSTWGGALVRLENVTAVRDGDGGDVVGPYGVIRLVETALPVHDKIYFYDLSDPGPGSSLKAPSFSYPTTFRSITGLVYLDYCTWSLAPRSKCDDFDPPSEDCR